MKCRNMVGRGRRGEAKSERFLWKQGACFVASFRASRAKCRLPDGSIVSAPLDLVALFPDGRVTFVEAKAGGARMTPAERACVRGLLAHTHGCGWQDGAPTHLEEHRWKDRAREPIVRDLTREE